MIYIATYMQRILLSPYSAEGTLLIAVYHIICTVTEVFQASSVALACVFNLSYTQGLSLYTELF